MKKKILWKSLLIIGIIPFIVVLFCGIYYSLVGFSGICIVSCNKYYGLLAFRDSVILYSFVFWPSYIVGLVLIIISILKLKK